MPQGHQIASVGFFRHLDRKEIELGQVTTETLKAYRENIEKLTVCPDPDRRLAQILKALNWANQHVPEWPLPTIRFHPYSETELLGFPLIRFPKVFQEDVQCCIEHLTGAAQRLALFEAGPAHADLDSNRTARNLRPASIENVLWVIRCTATILVRQGVPITEIHSLQDFFVPFARIRSILESELDRNHRKTRYFTHKLASVLTMLASRYCNVSSIEIKQIATWAKRLRMPKTKGMTLKNRKRLRTLSDQRVRAMLLHFPTHLMAEAASVAVSQPKVAARLAMYAAALEILLICPMRRANLVGLRLDRHLHRSDPRKALITHIFIEEDEVKNGEALQWPIPVESAKLIATYLNKYRHHLTGLENQYLMPGIGNRSICPATVGAWVSRSVARYIGVEFNLHLIRHFSAWNFLRQNPGQYEVVRRALGHKTLETTIRYYVGLEADAAAKHFDTAVLRDRQATRIIAKNAFRGGRGGF